MILRIFTHFLIACVIMVAFSFALAFAFPAWSLAPVISFFAGLIAGFIAIGLALNP